MFSLHEYHSTASPCPGKRTLTAAVALFAAAALALAQSTAETKFAHWTIAQFKAYTGKLAPKTDDKKLASEQLGNYGNHTFEIVYREASGESEVHETKSDFFIVQGGAATLVLGGEMVNGKSATPGEIRGTSIKGGERRKLTVGDVVHISPKLPHQLLIEPGQNFTYAVIKVDAY